MCRRHTVFSTFPGLKEIMWAHWFRRLRFRGNRLFQTSKTCKGRFAWAASKAAIEEGKKEPAVTASPQNSKSALTSCLQALIVRRRQRLSPRRKHPSSRCTAIRSWSRLMSWAEMCGSVLDFFLLLWLRPWLMF